MQCYFSNASFTWAAGTIVDGTGDTDPFISAGDLYLDGGGYISCYWTNVPTNSIFLHTELTMQPDGNLVYYDYTSGKTWATGTNSGVYVPFQDDGNLVEYNSSNAALWASNTSGLYTDRLVFQPDGNLVIYYPYNGRWTSFFATQTY